MEQVRDIKPPPSGFFGWLELVRGSLTGLQRTWRENLRRNPRRTWLLTALLVLGLAYPLLNLYVLAPFSRNVYPLPIPGDTEVVFMLIFRPTGLLGEQAITRA